MPRVPTLSTQNKTTQVLRLCWISRWSQFRPHEGACDERPGKRFPLTRLLVWISTAFIKHRFRRAIVCPPLRYKKASFSDYSAHHCLGSEYRGSFCNFIASSPPPPPPIPSCSFALFRTRLTFAIAAYQPATKPAPVSACAEDAALQPRL